MTAPTAHHAPVAPLWHLALRQVARDFRAGELRLLVVAVMLAVAALTAVGFFADRLNHGLARDARQMLGGDAIVASDQPLPPTFEARARELGLSTGLNVTFPSMGRAGDDKGGGSRLVAVKAVTASYPLRGKLRINAGPGTPDEQVARGPAAGTVWVDIGLLEAIGLKVGDPLLLGDASLRIEKTILAEPDRGAGFSSFSPRVMLSHSDLAATALIQPASRVTYRLAVASPRSDDAAVKRFVAWADAEVKTHSLRGVRIEALESGRPEMRQTLDRAEKFLNLVALLAALLSAVAVGIASRDFAERHLDDCAMLRVLGQSQRRIAWQYLIEFTLVGAIASTASEAGLRLPMSRRITRSGGTCASCSTGGRPKAKSSVRPMPMPNTTGQMPGAGKVASTSPLRRATNTKCTPKPTATPSRLAKTPIKANSNA